jgi:hypothetical protein
MSVRTASTHWLPNVAGAQEEFSNWEVLIIMKQLSSHVAVLTICLLGITAATVVAYDGYDQVPPGTEGNPPYDPGSMPPWEERGGIIYWNDEAAFDAEFPGLTFEDFSEAIGHIGPDGVSICTGPLNSETNNECFSPGDIEPGITIHNMIDDLNVALTPFFLGVDCVVVGPNAFDADALLMFDPPVQAMGGHAVCPFGPFPTHVQIFDADGNLIGETDISCSPQCDLFYGISAPEPIIAMLTFVAGPGNGELFGNLRWGTMEATPVQATTWGHVKSMYR